MSNHCASQPKDNTYGTLNEKRPVVQVVSRDPASDARGLLAGFLRAAFRRPVKEVEIAGYLDVFTRRLKAGDHFQDALKEAYRAALLSPDFMLLGSDVASRLSISCGRDRRMRHSSPWLSVVS